MNRIEKISHYAVVVIAVSALVVSIWQANITIQHNKLTVKPYLDFHVNQQDSQVTVSFSNEGFGPAIIDRILFYYKDQQFENIFGVLEEMGETDNWLGSYNYAPGTVISPGSRKLIINMTGGFHHRGVKALIRYKSIYEEPKPYELEINF